MVAGFFTDVVGTLEIACAAAVVALFFFCTAAAADISLRALDWNTRDTLAKKNRPPSRERGNARGGNPTVLGLPN